VIIGVGAGSIIGRGLRVWGLEVWKL